MEGRECKGQVHVIKHVPHANAISVRWITGPWSSCSEPCGPNGFQTRTVHCQQRVSATFTMRVAEGACLEKQPESRKGCFIKPCHQWTTSAWSQCSTPCGNGIRSRKVECTDSTGGKIDDKSCDLEEKPAEISACNMGPCEGVDWFTSDWSYDCSEVCGNGLQTRHVVCSGLDAGAKRISSYDDPENNMVEDGMMADATATNSVTDYRCDESKKPSAERECFADRFCGEPSWFAGPWSQCSASCGQGLRSRQILCVSFSRGKFKVVDHSLCSSSDKPDDTSPCDHPNPCPPRWFTSEWSECSASCDGGVQRRSVSCRGTNWTMSSSLCVDANRPVDRRGCNEQKCEDEAAPRSPVSTPSPPGQPTSRASGSGGEGGRASSKEEPSSAQSHGHRSQSVQNVSHEMHTDAEVSDGECTDQYRNCPLVVQARLCRYKYYRSVCCSACSD